MLTEREVKILYDTACGVVIDALNEVTLDRHVAEAEIQAQAYAKVLGLKYEQPKRKR